MPCYVTGSAEGDANLAAKEARALSLQDKTLGKGKRAVKLRAREGMTPDEAKANIRNVGLEYGARFILEELKARFDPRTLNRALERAFPPKAQR